MAKQNILIINGKKYESTTGELLDAPKKSISAKKPKSKTSPKKAKAPSKVASAKKPLKPKPKAERKAATSIAPHKPAKAQTLMRKGLSKPEASTKRKLRTTTHLATTNKTVPPKIEVKKSALKVDKQLLSYASKIKKSPLIRHFNPVPKSEYSFEASTKTNITPVSAKSVAVKNPKRKPQTTEELLEYAISQATSHEEPLAPKPKRKLKLRLKRKA